MQTLILFAVFFGTVFVLLGVFVFVNRRRLETVAALRERMRGGMASQADVNILRDIRKSAVPFLDRFLTGQSITPLIERNIQRFAQLLGVRRRHGDARRRRGARHANSRHQHRRPGRSHGGPPRAPGA